MQAKDDDSASAKASEIPGPSERRLFAVELPSELAVAPALLLDLDLVVVTLVVRWSCTETALRSSLRHSIGDLYTTISFLIFLASILVEASIV
jgi:hypothetical protein